MDNTLLKTLFRFAVRFLILSLGPCLILIAWSSDIIPSARYAQNRVLISFKPTAQPKPQALLGLLRGAKINPSVLNQFHYLTLPPNLSVPEALRQLANNPVVEYAEPDWIVHGADVIPSDPNFADQWFHRNSHKPSASIQTPQAWEITRGSSNVIVAVLDSGLADLPEFSGRTVPGYNFVSTNSNTHDDHGHGTQVAGVLAANANNNFLGVGVDWNCRIMPIKVFDESNMGFHSWWAQGIDYAVSNGCKIINLSGSGTEFGRTVQRAITNAIARGVIFVTVAGNSAGTNLTFPGYLTTCITVGATDSDDRRARFSNSGPQLDLVAPGVAIPTVGLSGDIEYVEGTSLSAPLVSGVCALLASLRPNITQSEARLLLCAGADDQVGDDADIIGFDTYYGWGRLNAFNSLILARTQLDSIHFESNRIELSWKSPSNATTKRPYQVQYSTSLSDPWRTTSAGIFRYENAQTIWHTPIPASDPEATGIFYRVQLSGY